MDWLMLDALMIDVRCTAHCEASSADVLVRRHLLCLAMDADVIYSSKLSWPWAVFPGSPVWRLSYWYKLLCLSSQRSRLRSALNSDHLRQLFAYDSYAAPICLIFSIIAHCQEVRLELKGGLPMNYLSKYYRGSTRPRGLCDYIISQIQLSEPVYVHVINCWIREKNQNLGLVPAN